MSDYEKIACVLALNLVYNPCLVETGKVISASEWLKMFDSIRNKMCNPFKLTNTHTWAALKEYAENHL